LKKYIFDVDGTLTPSRGVIDSEFKKFFNNFCRSNQVFIVTGSDKPKTVEQLGEDTYNLCHTAYQCNGNDVWQSKKHIRTNDWVLPTDAHDWLSVQLTESEFPLRTGLHFEHRPGMVNYSVVGRNADAQQRAEYVTWDEEQLERIRIADKFNLRFPSLQAKVGGETGIDIGPKGADKSQIIKDFDPDDKLHFYGDAMHKGGNDEPLAKVILDNQYGFCYNIQDWKNTWILLKDYDN